MNPIIIDKQDDLKNVIDEISNSDIIFLDTEFKREKTYHPILCLLQIYISGDIVYLVDPLSESLDISDLMTALKDSDAIKVFHSAYQDLEIFYHSYGFIPQPLMDTQIMASFLGYGEQASFDFMVQSFCDIKLDKSQQRTNWEKRPLNEKQIIYAAGDVYYLKVIYDRLITVLYEKNRQEWIQENIDYLINPKSYQIQEDKVLKKVKHHFNDAISINIVKYLAVWREKKAEEKNTIRNMILDDKDLVSFVQFRPKTIEEALNIHKIPKHKINKYGDEIIEIIDIALNNPPLKKDYVPPLSSADKKIVELLSLYLKQISEDLSISTHNLATTQDLRQYVLNKDVKFSSGWRYDIIGNILEAIKNGEKGLFYRMGKLTLLDG